MNLQKQVVSLEHAKRLKQLGIVQKSLFYLQKEYSSDTPTIYTYDDIEGWGINPSSQKHLYSAYTVAELGAMMPPDHGTFKDFDFGFTIQCLNKNEEGKFEMNHYHYNGTEAEARADMLIYLLESKIITAEDINENLRDFAS